jgi:hypothetical protein
MLPWNILTEETIEEEPAMSEHDPLAAFLQDQRLVGLTELGISEVAAELVSKLKEVEDLLKNFRKPS